jgi:hypothetical protein
MAVADRLRQYTDDLADAATAAAAATALSTTGGWSLPCGGGAAVRGGVSLRHRPAGEAGGEGAQHICNPSPSGQWRICVNLT